MTDTDVEEARKLISQAFRIMLDRMLADNGARYDGMPNNEVPASELARRVKEQALALKADMEAALGEPPMTKCDGCRAELRTATNFADQGRISVGDGSSDRIRSDYCDACFRVLKRDIERTIANLRAGLESCVKEKIE